MTADDDERHMLDGRKMERIALAISRDMSARVGGVVSETAGWKGETMGCIMVFT